MKLKELRINSRYYIGVMSIEGGAVYIIPSKYIGNLGAYARFIDLVGITSIVDPERIFKTPKQAVAGGRQGSGP